MYTGPNIVRNGLVLCLDAASLRSYPGSGTTWNDLSGNGNTGTLSISGSNAVSASFDSSNGGSILFSGTGSFVSSSDVPFRFGNTFSISIWLFWDGLDKTNIALMGKRNGSPYNQYSFSINNGNPYTGGTGKTIIFFAREDSGNAAKDTSLTYTFPSSGIYNIVSTINTTSQALYVNGTQISGSAIDYTGNTFNIPNRDLLIGSTRNDAGTGISNSFNNKIYNVQIYNRALNASEITQNFNATKTRFGL